MCFNPRTRVGCDDVVVAFKLQCRVSIHAPVWGATFYASISPLFSAFQSTHPCGVRPILRAISPFIKGFNPRTRVGCDIVSRQPQTFIWFQSTHPCGVRQSTPILLPAIPKFQSTHPCGVRHNLCTAICQDKVSIHAPVWGATIVLRPLCG